MTVSMSHKRKSDDITNEDKQKWHNVPGFYYEVANLTSTIMSIRRIGTNRILKPHNGQVCLHDSHKNRRMMLVHRCGALAVHPLPEKYIGKYTFDELHVDHIDGNHLNNNFSNLQWLSKSDHSVKTMNQTKHSRQSNGPARSKKIIVATAEHGAKYFPGHIFESATAAATAIGIHPSCVSSSARRAHQTIGNDGKAYTFRYVIPDDLPGEVWSTPNGNTPNEYKGFMASSKGRIETPRGVRTIGSSRASSPYRTTQVNLVPVNIHTAIWEMFYGPVPDDMVVDHDDKIAKIGGLHRNFLCDLSLKTRSENVQAARDYKGTGYRIRLVSSPCGTSEIGVEMTVVDICKRFNINRPSFYKKVRKNIGLETSIFTVDALVGYTFSARKTIAG